MNQHEQMIQRRQTQQDLLLCENCRMRAWEKTNGKGIRLCLKCADGITKPIRHGIIRVGRNQQCIHGLKRKRCKICKE